MADVRGLGPWWEGDINAELFETVLSYGRAQGSARLLLGAMAALADEKRIVEGVMAERAVGRGWAPDKTYRRAQEALLASGELVVRRGRGGRGNTNVWEIPDPRLLGADAGPAVRRRVAPPPARRPLVAGVPAEPAPAVEEVDAEDGLVEAADGGGKRAGAPAGMGRTIGHFRTGRVRSLPGFRR